MKVLPGDATREVKRASVNERDFWHFPLPTQPLGLCVPVWWTAAICTWHSEWIVFQTTLWWTTAPVWERAPATRWRWRRTALRCAFLVLTFARKVNHKDYWKMFWLVLVTDNVHINLAILEDKVPNIAANIGHTGDKKTVTLNMVMQ